MVSIPYHRKSSWGLFTYSHVIYTQQSQNFHHWKFSTAIAINAWIRDYHATWIDAGLGVCMNKHDQFWIKANWNCSSKLWHSTFTREINIYIITESFAYICGTQTPNLIWIPKHEQRFNNCETRDEIVKKLKKNTASLPCTTWQLSNQFIPKIIKVTSCI